MNIMFNRNRFNGNNLRGEIVSRSDKCIIYLKTRPKHNLQRNNKELVYSGHYIVGIFVSTYYIL